jgi:hypothetical protein
MTGTSAPVLTSTAQVPQLNRASAFPGAKPPERTVAADEGILPALSAGPGAPARHEIAPVRWLTSAV